MSGESGTSGLVASSTRRTKPPPRGEREWVHPSELPSFEKLRTHQIWPIKFARGPGRGRTHGGRPGRRLGRFVPHPIEQSPRDTRTSPRPQPLPSNSQKAAADTVDLSISTPGHVDVVAAMVLPHNLAVTTTQIPADALITGSTPGDVNFPVHWVGRDQVMGFSIVRLGRHVPALSFAPLPASKWVVAVSPILKSSTTPPQYAWANTILGIPRATRPA